MILHDFVMLGKTVPEPTNERLQHYVCSAGWSETHGLIRLYPLDLKNTPRRWSVNRVQVERHPGNKDSRPETWCPVSAFGSSGEFPVEDRRMVLEKYLTSGIIEANEQRRSLTVVRPGNIKFRLTDSATDGEPSYRLFENGRALKAKERFAHVPKIQFDTQDGRKHNIQMRDWGLWELMRKNHDQLADMSALDREIYVGNSLHMNDKTLFLIGNYANHRTSWLVISSLNLR